MSHIDPERTYSFAEACRLIPGRSGRLSLSSLHRWRKQGLLTATCRQTGGKRFWFVTGAELQALLARIETLHRGKDGGPVETPAARKARQQAALDELRRAGWM